MSAKPNEQRRRQRRGPASRSTRKPRGTGATERRSRSHPLFGEIPLIPDPAHEGCWRFDPTYEPPLPDGAVRGCIERQEYCAAHHVPRYFYVDRELACVQCGEAFTFSADEQKHWYETLGFHHHAEAVRCVACRRQRRSEKALNGQIARAREALRASPEDPSHLLALAEATARLHEATGHGDLDRAIAAARSALRRMPRAVEAHFWEGRCHQLAGRETKAREAFERFLESRPVAPRLKALRDEARGACEGSRRRRPALQAKAAPQPPLEPMTDAPDPTAADFPPPHYVRGNVAPADDAAVTAIRSEYGSWTTVFSLQCDCGGRTFSLSLHDDGTPHPWSPMHAVCTACERTIVAFDETITGYDGLVVFKDRTPPAADLPVTCPACGQGAFGLAIGFQYSELDETDELLAELGDGYGYEDLFGWFVGYPTCDACAHGWEVLSIECM